MDEERCYICNRTEEEVDKLLFSEYFDDADHSSLEHIESWVGVPVKICVVCKSLIKSIPLSDTDWLDGYVTERTFDMLSEIIDALEAKKKELTNHDET